MMSILMIHPLNSWELIVKQNFCLTNLGIEDVEILQEDSKESIHGGGLEMCVHYWIIDRYNKGICKRCGGEKDFSPPPIKMTNAERSEMRMPFNHDFYRRGGKCHAELDVQ